ncbi:bifunctional DNA primase/polymerase [Streptomyces sp. DSM 44915]|uniref:Bifunctional DNA primase/polymerase n=1 Tax=Streptomyces chisholmiae TaxID=3075540 RepID=A0ABU2JKP5_9ACTN|nr:bifunctional DNA primase/polymerase [Streptomyces sp. DSM 44915]MDT0265560.1 bifunctional DNA primase/polymerase [Streptomyces sp. DSM 44915]
MTHAVMPEQPAPGHTSALGLAGRGWHVFPLIPGTKRPAITRWEDRATTDTARITRCWSRAGYNIGLATGPSHLVVIDLDVPKPGEDGPDGAWYLAALCERHDRPYPADTFTVATPSGGTHLYFTAPENGARLRNTAGRLAPKVDTRASGGYVVAPGSTVHGHPYAVLNDMPPAPLPAWLVPVLAPAPLPPQRPITVPLLDHDRRGRYLKAAVNAELKRVADSAPHEHNRDLFRASVALGQLVAGGALSAADVTAWLAEAAAQVGQRPGEASRTIRSGLRAGARRPRQVAA